MLLRSAGGCSLFNLIYYTIIPVGITSSLLLYRCYIHMLMCIARSLFLYYIMLLLGIITYAIYTTTAERVFIADPSYCSRTVDAQ
jgi:hypothetical protein